MVGTRTATGSKFTASLRFELVERLVGRLHALTARADAEQVAEIARTDLRPRTIEADPRQPYLDQYRELTAAPVRWVRLT
jgi:hypothetical protein